MPLRLLLLLLPRDERFEYFVLEIIQGRPKSPPLLPPRRLELFPHGGRELLHPPPRHRRGVSLAVPAGRPSRRPVRVRGEKQLAAVEGEGARGALHVRHQAGHEPPGLVDDPRVAGAGSGACRPGVQDALDAVDYLARQPGDALARRLERPQVRGALRGW